MKIKFNKYVELLLLATAIGGIAVRQWLIPSLTWPVQALLFGLSFGVLNVIWAFHFQFNEWLNHRLPFEKNARWRIIVQVLGGWSVVKMLFLIVSYFVNRYFFPPAVSLLGGYTFLVIGIMVFLVNTVICLGFIASHLLNRWQENAVRTAQLEKEKVQVQLDSLKNQISPHFLFNSLSSLDSLIDDNPVLARQFLQQLSRVFRYVLQHKEKSLVTVETELSFIKNYISLLHTRFDGTFVVTCQVDDSALDQQIVPVTLQILIENAIKHNIINAEHPLTVTISTHEGYIAVSNPIQRKRQVGTSNGQGLENLKLLYSYVGPNPVDVGDDGETFRVQIPLLLGE
jgi:two-component system LytT family sensor kinase